MNNLVTNIPHSTVAYLWRGLGLPDAALNALDLPVGDAFSSSFKVWHLAQSTVATAALTGALIHATRSSSPIPRVRVEVPHAAAAFVSERLLRIDGNPPPSAWGVLGGLYATRDGHVRIHDSFAHHRASILRVLGLAEDESRCEAVAEAVRTWDKVALEEAALASGAVAYALRSEAEWEATGQAQAQADKFPISLRVASPSPSPFATVPPLLTGPSLRPLTGLRVLDLSRVIAAPVAGRTLAALGADVLWVTSPNLPSLPGLDGDMTRGKRSISLDLDDAADAAKLCELVKTANVFLQSYRPGALSSRGWGREDVRRLNPGIIYASLSAWGPGPWECRRGFDSLVQTASGLNVLEAEGAELGQATFTSMPHEPKPARPLPCQALDHGAGYLLAAGILAAVYRRMIEPTNGGWDVDLSLADVMELLRSLGRQAFSDVPAPSVNDDAWLETTRGALGEVTGVSFPATINGVDTSLGRPSVRGADVSEWL
ncbi:hypothetical protein CcaverHIS002_0702260 [Cutaneotrichosporon cavernicola]|nr:hypothetical protein CcaverHIS002_0702260 [Cutaneotrichosporon cavernicola]